LIKNFVDSQSIVDLSALAPSGFYGGSDAAANRGTGATLSAVFGGETPGQVDFAVVNGDTYIHMAGLSGGYSTTDLLIHLQGVHALNQTNLHVGPPP
jgi:hypothetical protein